MKLFPTVQTILWFVAMVIIASAYVAMLKVAKVVIFCSIFFQTCRKCQLI